MTVSIRACRNSARSRLGAWGLRAGVAVAVCVGAPAACSSGRNSASDVPTTGSALTPGGVKLNLKKGETTQQQMLEAFGTPDHVTYKDGLETWTYDKTTYEFEKRSDYWTVIFAGAGGDRVRSSSRSTLLMVFFDAQDVVSDYRMSAIKY